jgi:hypothetical protein
MEKPVPPPPIHDPVEPPRDPAPRRPGLRVRTGVRAGGEMAMAVIRN